MADTSKPVRRGRIPRRRLILVGLGLLVVVFVASQLIPPLFPSRGVAQDELVVFFPTAAHLDADGATWEVPIHGWIFEPESGDTTRGVLVSALRALLGIDANEPESSVFARRTRLFLVDNERGKQIAVQVAGREIRMQSSRHDGHFEARLSIPSTAIDGMTTSDELEVRAVTDPGDSRDFSGTVHLIPNEGLSVVSDIDDTVKLSDVTDRKQLLRNTFLEEFRAVPGMAAVYRRWAQERGARFHFVSSSPWQLYEELASFLRSSGFPPASYHLKAVRFKDASVLDLFGDPLESKLAVIEPLMRRFGDRQFVLVGDSGEKDPEVYGTLARRFPGQVVHVFIRNVTGEEASSSRFVEAFDGVPREKWSLFTDASTVRLPGR